MQTDRTTSPTPDRPDFPDVCIATGYTTTIRTDYGHLRVEDEDRDGRRVRRFARATVPFSRLVVRSIGGYITTEAIRWCHDVGVAIYMIDANGEIIAVAGDLGSDRPRLRRAQARAAGTGLAIDITRWLLQAKLHGQARVADRLSPEDPIEIPNLSEIEVGHPTELLTIEGEVAAAYWRSWEHIEVRFVEADLPRIPEHWRHFGRRRSPISGTPHRAGNPAAATLNYLYSIAAAEIRLACLGMGLDPGLGVYHLDKKTRDSMVYDLIEAVRPSVDEYLLDLLEGHVFRAADFYETRRGLCRIAPLLAGHLAATGPHWAKHAGPIVEHVAQMLLPNTDLPTPLTNRNLYSDRNAGRHIRTQIGAPKASAPSSGCHECGGASRGHYCDECRPHIYTQAGQRSALLRSANGESEESRSKRSETMAVQRRRNILWDAANGNPDPETFSLDILPGLARVSLGTMASATGLSKSYCSQIRRGEFTPHPRHWSALDRLVQQENDTATL